MAWGFTDRGLIAAGMRADLNVFDFDALRLDPPFWAADLPAGGRRLLQYPHGYDYTFCAGQMTWKDGEHTGVLPGKLVRAVPK